MLSRSQRLNSTAFAVAFEKGRPFRHPLMQVRLYRRGEAELSGENGSSVRTAFVVPKKLGKAAWRNRVRRRVRERYRLGSKDCRSQQQAKAEVQGCDLIFLINAQCHSATIEEIDKALKQLLQRATRSFLPPTGKASRDGVAAAADSNVKDFPGQNAEHSPA